MNRIIMSPLYYLFVLFSFETGYKAVYKIDYIPNLATNSLRTELALLIIDEKQNSSYASKNTFKMDSVMKYVRENNINPHEVMNEKLPKTGFNHFVKKNYAERYMKVSNLIAIDNYVYIQKNELKWQLSSDTLTIKNYVCNKATVSYEGRDYTAWYTTEIPIPDGPYKFWGLPGLIIKIYDTENHYTFTLEGFEKYTGQQYPTPYQTIKSFEVTYDKFRVLNKEFIENPLKALENRGTKIISFNGENPNIQLNKRKVNPIERY